MAVGQMMVRDDAIHAQFARPCQHLVLANSRVDADDHAKALGGGFLHHRHPHAIAISETVRNVRLHLGA